jgi:NADH-quinone oxidoreductase subunit N
VLIGVVVGTARGVEAMLVYLALYVFMQLGAFTVIVLMRRRDVMGDELKDLSGLYLRNPVAAFAMLFFMLSLGGIPPTAGFIGKVFLFGAAIEAGYIWLAVIAVVNSALSLYYYVRVVVFIWIKEDIIGSPVTISPALAAALGVALLGTLALGVYPQFLIDFARTSALTLGVADAVALGP